MCGHGRAALFACRAYCAGGLHFSAFILASGGTNSSMFFGNGPENIAGSGVGGKSFPTAPQEIRLCHVMPDSEFNSNL